MDKPTFPPGFASRAALPPGLDARSAAVLREIVEQYVETGEPVGSRTLSRRLPMNLSPATIRNVMADLTDAGLLFAPHTSAGRLPTDQGLRLFVDGLLHFGELAEDEREAITAALAASGRSLEDTLAEASSMLSGLSQAAGLVLAPKSDGAIRHIEFVPLGSGPRPRGPGERRRPRREPGDRDPARPAALGAPAGGQLPECPPLRPLAGRIAADRRRRRWPRTGPNSTRCRRWWWRPASPPGPARARPGSLIVRGQARLLSDVTQIERLTAIQALFDRLEAQETMLRLLELAEQSEGVRIFIGAESGLFGTSGVSMVVAPARSDGGRIVGAIGVIGPTRINYGRIIPVVDYTARVIGRLLG